MTSDEFNDAKAKVDRYQNIASDLAYLVNITEYKFNALINLNINMKEHLFGRTLLQATLPESISGPMVSLMWDLLEKEIQDLRRQLEEV